MRRPAPLPLALFVLLAACTAPAAPQAPAPVAPAPVATAAASATAGPAPAARPAPSPSAVRAPVASLATRPGALPGWRTRPVTGAHPGLPAGLRLHGLDGVPGAGQSTGSTGGARDDGGDHGGASSDASGGDGSDSGAGGTGAGPDSGLADGDRNGQGQGDGDGQGNGNGGAGQGQGNGSGAPLTTLRCADVPTYAGVPYQDTERGPFDLRYLPGTAAAADLDAIFQDRQRAYDRISDFLGLTTRPRITVVLSPSRLAAFAHGYSVGQAFPWKHEVDVLYLPGADSYERHHFGHELTHVLAAAVDGKNDHLPFLDEGLAVYLDGSGRDLHQAYVDDLAAGAEDATYTYGFDDNDTYGRNYGRAGSFLTLFVARYGRGKLLDLWRAAAVTWHGWTMVDTLGDTISDGRSLTRALDHLLREVTGEGLDALRAAWRDALAPYLAQPTTAVSDADRAAIAQVLHDADAAVDDRDAGAYRATMDGFYCDALDDDARARIAAGKTDTEAEVHTRILAVAPTGTRNYPEVIVHALRTSDQGERETTQVVEYWLERFPAGWRLTWSTAW